jgi:aspartate/methionine/tyrosine aminotransferase
MLPASGIREIFDRAKQKEATGKPVLHLEIGRPEWRLPPGAADAAKLALDQGLVHYIENRGLLELRRALSEDIAHTAGRHFDPERELIVTCGASEALSMCGLALLGPGDEVIIPQPAWNHYRAVVEMVGATPVPLALSSKDGFVLDPERVAGVVTERTKLIILNSPGNPSGTVQPREHVEAIARLALRRGIFVFADEIYRDFVYEGEHASVARYMGDSEFLLYANSFSKSYAMTGWRIGYIAAQASISDALNRVHQYLTVCGVPFAQKGAVRVLQHPERHAYLGEMRRAFSERLAVWRDALVGCPGAELEPPGGAFYVFPRIEYKGMSARQFCTYMLEEHQVAMVPGEVFGEDYSQCVRISYGRDLETQRTAARKLVEVLHG